MAIDRLRTLIARAEPLTYAALRAIAGAMLAFHGMQKILGWYTSRAGPAVGSQLWLGGLIELVAGSLIALGLFTRAAAFLASGTMAVAYVQYHWKLNLAGGMWIPTVNKGELALLYAFVFLFIAARGSGPASLDQVVPRRGRS